LAGKLAALAYRTPLQRTGLRSPHVVVAGALERRSVVGAFGQGLGASLAFRRPPAFVALAAAVRMSNVGARETEKAN